MELRGSALNESPSLGSLCRNCLTPLKGQWCYVCGQSTADYHRSTLTIAKEALAEFFSYDGRLAKTVLRLIARPADLTRSYVAGRRASQLSPLRLFITVLIAVIVVGWMTGGAQFGAGMREGWRSAAAAPEKTGAISAAGRQEKADASVAAADGSQRSWLREQARRAEKNPDKFWQAVEDWSERTSFMMLPIATMLLYLLYRSKGSFYVFDHAVFAMHSLSFQGLLLASAFVIDLAGGWVDWLVFALLVIGAPTHLYVHMRGFYETGPLGTLARMLLLALGSVFGFALLTLALVLIGLHSV